tara:strand:+ start:5195 stop:7255 length:2061 start_codon:yes stop_codon:yes gene_type:complete
MQLKRTISASVIINVAVATLFGAIATLVQPYFLPPSQLPLLSATCVIAGFMVSAIYFGYVLQKYWLTRLAGAALFVFGIILLFVEPITLALSNGMPPLTMRLFVLMAGATFCVFKVARLYRALGLATSIYGLVVGVFDLYCLFTMDATLASQLNVFEVSLCAFVITVVSATLLAMEWSDEYNYTMLSPTSWLTISLTQFTVACLWTYVSTSQINKILEVGDFITMSDPILIAAQTSLMVYFVGFVFSIVLTFAFFTNTRLRVEKDKISYIAQHDSTTGLYRRSYLEQYIQNHLDNHGHSGWVIFIDLDGFKPINDSLGQSTGNIVLTTIAKRLLDDKPHFAKVARFSSDEFIIFVKTVKDFKVEDYCQQLINLIREKIAIDEFYLHVTASLGVYRIENRETSAEDAIQRADVAMSSAKKLGGNNFVLYQDKMAKHYHEALCLRNRLQIALDNNQLDVHYQPIIDAQSGRIKAVEALARWPQQDGSFISPGKFIPVAEQTGQITQLSQFVMSKAIRDMAPMCRKHGIRLSLNLSVQQFHQTDIAQDLINLCKTYHFNPSDLCAELTESVVAKDIKLVKQKLTTLNEAGIQIAIDDFGTGYSSLSYLSDLPIDILKIDKSFTDQVTQANTEYPLVDSIIYMAQQLNKTIVVEGIEDAVQHDYFSARGCHYLQGFKFYKPMPLADLNIA